MAPKGPFRLVTVNTVPERAKLIVGRVAEAVKEEWIIDHIENAEKIEEVKAICERQRPDVLFCASMWTKEESDKIQQIARETVPGIKTWAAPQGLQAKIGPDGMVELLKKQLPEILAS
ncbi:hypothetical protein F5884DRAFT_206334 [Xylogone sp. PMI_703]|nr:hypothetical protein F5884DRAFT_206334 [Xylogone sp. PMI_703]